MTHLPRQTFDKAGRLLVVAVQRTHADHVQSVVKIMGLNLNTQGVEFGIPLEDLGHIDLFHGVAQVFHHAVKAFAEIFHLIAAADIHLCGEIAALHLLHGSLELPCRRGDPTAEEKGGGEGKGDSKEQQQHQIGAVGGMDAVQLVAIEGEHQRIRGAAHGTVVYGVIVAAEMSAFGRQRLQRRCVVIVELIENLL